MRLTDYDEDQM